MIGPEHQDIIAKIDLINGDFNNIKNLSNTYSTDQNHFFALISQNALDTLNALHNPQAPLNRKSVDVIAACEPVIKNTAILLKSDILTYECSIEIYRAVLRVAEKPEEKIRIQELERVAQEFSGPGIIDKIMANLCKAMGYLLMYVGTKNGKEMGKAMVARANAVLNIKGTLFSAHQAIEQSSKNQMQSGKDNNLDDDEEGLDLLQGKQL